MRVHEVMCRPVVTVYDDIPVRVAAVTLAERGFAALPVLDRDQRLTGVLTSGDILRAGESDAGVTVAAAMTTPALAATANQDLAEVIAMLLARGVRSLPVLDDEGRVQGMFSRGDALRLMLRPDETVAAGAQARLDDYTGARRWGVTACGGTVTITGIFADASERRIATALARTVPGVRDVTLNTAPLATASITAGSPR
ncbi:CBS domain pair family protein (plasmid) [Rhodococcus opacus]|uniref:CBS domain pair family protein n=1 Tax=Rhodococcus opacus TaxID=37919 RepID=A0A1B1KHH8_RHOOP|nr:CBS domain-containing protein [Rhodococcus opacus]ANS32038.1 CBS domain pair family protein [Rhodococcus opacus]